MTLDGRGERAATTYGIARGVDYEEIGSVNVPHSLGLLYEDVTDHLGFLRSSDEYKVMALASFGEPTFVDQLRSLIDLGMMASIALPRSILRGALAPNADRRADRGMALRPGTLFASRARGSRRSTSELAPAQNEINEPLYGRWCSPELCHECGSAQAFRLSADMGTAGCWRRGHSAGGCAMG